MGRVTNSETFQIQTLYQVETDLIAFVDGSVKTIQGSSRAGIGGIIQYKNGDSIFTFSGPYPSHCPAEAEWGALCHLLKKFPV